MRRRKKQRAETAAFSLSFLDAVSCGFGALVILLVLTKMGQPVAIEEAREDLDAQILALQEELYNLRGESRILDRTLKTRIEQISEEEKAIARLRGDLSKIQGEFAATQQLAEVQENIEGRLLAAQQELTEEMKRLLGQSFKRPKTDNTVGGIPVDSEYIVFIIDTSGSMKSFAWPLVRRKMEQVLNVYPKVKGIQVMNDMGQYLYTSYSGRWIPDTPGRRKVILSKLAGWDVFSNSSPVEGIERAISTFARPDRKMSIYVFGDEFTGNSIDAVVRKVDRINPKDKDGNPTVRIHGIGFPVIFSGFSAEGTGVRFATLMRALCKRNGGTFVALNSAVP